MRGSGAVVRSVSSKRFDREEKKEKKRKEKREELEGVGGVKGREIIWNRTVWYYVRTAVAFVSISISKSI